MDAIIHWVARTMFLNVIFCVRNGAPGDMKSVRYGMLWDYMVWCGIWYMVQGFPSACVRLEIPGVSPVAKGEHRRSHVHEPT